MGEVGTLSILLWSPLVVALALLATGHRLPEGVWRGAAMLVTSFVFVASLPLWAGYDLVEGGYQFVERAPWIEDLGLHYYVGIDGISLMLVLLTTFLMPIVLLASWTEIERDIRGWVFAMLVLETALLGAFVSLNLFVFYLFCELALIPMYFLIGVWGGARRVHAAGKFLLLSMFGSLLMLVALLVLARLGYEQTGFVNFDWIAARGSEGLGLVDVQVPLFGDEVWWRSQSFLFLAFGLAFAIRVPVFPFHTWLPDAQVEAPTGGSVVLSALMLKVGTYGFLRFGMPLFPDAAAELAGMVLGLALVGIVYSALVALVQSDVKRVIAYASVVQLGFVMLGLFALNAQGLAGAVLHMVNHGLTAGALFVLVGFLVERRHTRSIAEFGGVARPMPVFAVLFGIALMASIGTPSLNLFVGELLVLLGTFEASPWVAVGAVVGASLAACAMVWTYRRVVFGPVDNPDNRALIDLGIRERIVVGALLVPMLALGLYPDAALRRIEPSVVRTLRTLDARMLPEVPELPEIPEAEPASVDAAAPASLRLASAGEGAR